MVNLGPFNDAGRYNVNEKNETAYKNEAVYRLYLPTFRNRLHKPLPRNDYYYLLLLLC